MTDISSAHGNHPPSRKNGLPTHGSAGPHADGPAPRRTAAPVDHPVARRPEMAAR